MIERITKDVILNGIGHPLACCMFDVANRTYQCSMWPQVFDEVGSIGYLAYEEDELVGQLIFLPKRYARRIGLSTCPANHRLETTMLVGCLLIHSEYRNRGLASAMIDEVISFCESSGFNRIEVGACNRPSSKEWAERISFLPFKKFGFVIDEAVQGDEFQPADRMCHLDL